VAICGTARGAEICGAVTRVPAHSTLCRGRSGKGCAQQDGDSARGGMRHNTLHAAPPNFIKIDCFPAQMQAPRIPAQR